MEMDQNTIKGVSGFNGTERPSAVYLVTLFATHAQKGLPAFVIYSHEVQDTDMVDTMPEDVKDNLDVDDFNAVCRTIEKNKEKCRWRSFVGCRV